MSRKVSELEPAQGLDLTPIMNMVLCLIPLMLLSVVFMTISVIDVSMPQRSAGAAANDGEPPKRLQLFVSSRGFTIVKGTETVPAISGCPADGPSICLKDDSAELDVKKYNWLELYNQLLNIKNDGWTEHEQIDIVADAGISYGVLVKAMDISRSQLVPHAESENASKGKILRSEAELDDAVAVQVEKEVDGQKALTSLDLFPVVVLGLPTMQ